MNGLRRLGSLRSVSNVVEILRTVRPAHLLCVRGRMGLWDSGQRLLLEARPIEGYFLRR